MLSLPRQRPLALPLAILGLAARAAAQAPSPEAARKEGKVILYGTIVPQIMRVIQKDFEAKHGIKIEYSRADATRVIDRAITEWRAGRPGSDLVTGARGALLFLKQEKVFASYFPPSAASFPAKFKDKDGQLTAWRVTPIGILYNSELVRGAEAPKSLDDLLDPRWRGKIAMPDPSKHGSTAQFLWNLQKLKGERWREFVRALANQKPHLMDAFAPIPATVARGETHLGITYVQYAAQHKGPLGFGLLEAFLTDPSDIGLSAKAANPNAARLFIDYLCSPEGQRRVAETGEFVLAPGIYPALKDADRVVANMLFMDNPSEEQLRKLHAEFRQIFYGS